MAIELKTTKYSGRTPEIWRGECKVLPGGFKPAQDNFPADFLLRRGTLVYLDFDNMTAAVCKAGKVMSGSTTTSIKVAKGNLFLKGDIVEKYGATAVDGVVPSATINAVDTSNENYDALTISASLSTSENDYLVIKGSNHPNAVVAADLKFTGKGLPTIDAAYEAVVLTSSLTYDLLPAWKDGIFLKSNPNILFIKQ